MGRQQQHIHKAVLLETHVAAADDGVLGVLSLVDNDRLEVVIPAIFVVVMIQRINSSRQKKTRQHEL